MASAIKGRGAQSQPPGRFDILTKTLEHDGWYASADSHPIDPLPQLLLWAGSA